MYHYNIKHCLRFLTLLGCNPLIQNSWIQLILYSLCICGSCVIIILAALLLFLSKRRMRPEEIAGVFSNIIAFFYVITKLIMMFTKKSEIQDLLYKIKNIFWEIENVPSMEERKEYMEMIIHAKYMFHIRIFLFMFWLFSSLRFNRLPMKCYRPSWVSLQTLIAFENIFCLVLVISIITVDILIMTILILTSIQFKMVSSEMKNLFTCHREEIYVDKIIKQRMKRLIDHHNFLLDFADMINRTFTISLVVYIGNVVTLLCIYMYHLSIMTTFSSYTVRDIVVVLLTLYGFIVCYCWPAQNFVDENDKIRVSAYFANWYSYPNYSKSILLVMKRLDLGVSISAGGIAKINVETCLKVVRLAISYYTFLRSATGE